MNRKYVLMALGTFCLALSSGLFIIPGNILSGGVAGISVAISPLIPNVPKEYISSFLMLLMFVLGANMYTVIYSRRYNICYCA